MEFLTSLHDRFDFIRNQILTKCEQSLFMVTRVDKQMDVQVLLNNDITLVALLVKSQGRNKVIGEYNSKQRNMKKDARKLTKNVATIMQMDI